jgi:hypothetical protein
MVRRWALLDAMILVGAIAVGLGAARWWYDQPGYVNPSALDAQSVCELIAWLLLPLSPALIGVRLRRPRPRWRRLVRQPGFQANLLVGMATVAALFNNRWGYRPTLFQVPFGIGSDQVNEVAPVVAVGWVLTALVGRRRPEPGMIDRLGRALGWAWIALWLARIIVGKDSLVRLCIGY